MKNISNLDGKDDSMGDKTKEQLLEELLEVQKMLEEKTETQSMGIQ